MSQFRDSVEVSVIMRSPDPEVVDAVWDAVRGLLPRRDRSHPLGCHRPRVCDRLCFWGLLIRLVTGSSWVDIEAILERRVSDTTLRARRDEWIEAGVVDRLCSEALAAFDKIVGLDLSEVSVDGSIHKAPCGGDGTGKSPVDKGKLGWKWSVASDRNGIPLGWAIVGANRNDIRLLEPTLAAVNSAGLLCDVETLHLDRGYDYPAVRRLLADACIQQRARNTQPRQPMRLGQRWIVESTNSWLSNYGQLRRNTDRRPDCRHAALCLATAILITAKLIDWKNRWNP